MSGELPKVVTRGGDWELWRMVGKEMQTYCYKTFRPFDF